MGRRWQRYESANGRDKIQDEIRKLRLKAHEQVALKDYMRDCADGKLSYPTVKPLPDTGGLLEIRIILAERSFRLVYADLPGGRVLLALHLFRKQRDRQQDDIRLAVRRYREWQASHPDQP